MGKHNLNKNKRALNRSPSSSNKKDSLIPGSNKSNNNFKSKFRAERRFNKRTEKKIQLADFHIKNVDSLTKINTFTLFLRKLTEKNPKTHVKTYNLKQQPTSNISRAFHVDENNVASFPDIGSNTLSVNNLREADTLGYRVIKIPVVKVELRKGMRNSRTIAFIWDFMFTKENANVNLEYNSAQKYYLKFFSDNATKIENLIDIKSIPDSDIEHDIEKLFEVIRKVIHRNKKQQQ